MAECGQLAGNQKRKGTGTFQYKNLNKSIAYLLGAYLSDGNIYKDRKKGWAQFTLEVIDQDFAERVQEAIVALTGQVTTTVFVRETPGKSYFKAYSGNQDLCRWLIEITNDKGLIPDIIWQASPELQKEFIAGLLDGDGWFCMGTRSDRDTKQFHLGYACTDPWIHDMVAMLHKLGVRTGRVIRQENGGVKPLYRFEINKESFVGSGMYFTIKRKQDRVELWRRSKGSSETKREPSLTRDEVIVRPS